MTFLYVSGFLGSLGSFFKWLSLPVFFNCFFKRIFYQVTLDDSSK